MTPGGGTGSSPQISTVTSALSASGEPLLLGLALDAIYLYDPAGGSQFPTRITLTNSFSGGDSLGGTATDNTGDLVITHGLFFNGLPGVAFLNQAGTSLDGSKLGFPGIIPYGNQGLIEMGDINGDGVSDVVSGVFDFNSHRMQVSVTVANNTTTIPPLVEDQLGFPEGGDLVVCDFDGDKVDDIIVAPGFTIYSGKTGTVSQIAGAPFFNLGNKLACGDLNGDGFDDLIIGQPAANNPVSGLPGLGQFFAFSAPGHPTPTTFFNTVSAAFGQDDDIAAGDMDGDGFAEFVVASGLSGTGGVVNVFSAPGKTAPKSPIISSFKAGSKVTIPRHTIPAPQPVTTHGFVPFQLQAIYYDPPGGASVQQYGANYTVTTSTNWQTVDKNGVVTSTGVTFGIGTGGNAGSVSGSSMLQYQWEDISGHGISATRTDSTTNNVSAHADIPSGLYDEFVLTLGIATTITVFPDPNKPQQVVLDYSNAKTLILSGQQLLAIAESSSTVDNLLNSPPVVDPSLISLVKGLLSPADARTILLINPNFFVTSNGSIALRNPAQLNQAIQADPDRFPAVPVNAVCIPVPGTVLPNTMPVPPAPQPNNQTQTNNCSQQLSNSTSSSTSTGNGTDLQFQQTVSTSFPIYGALTGQASIGYAYEEEKQKVTTTTTGPGTQDQITTQMSSPCLQGLVDLYYDAAFGTYVYVSHDIKIIPKPFNSDVWYDKLCVGNVASPVGTSCTANSDCGSQVCTNGICAPAACASSCQAGVTCCPVGQPCGLGGPFGDCSSQNCSIGLCAASLFMSACGVDGDCATDSCVSGACASPACAPHCQQGAGCGVNGDCNSQFCSDGICLPPACSPTCAEGSACGVNGDCASGVCTNGVCGPPACSPHCPQGNFCASDGECGSQVCTNGTCAPPACAPNCDFGAGCGANSDCVSQVCTNGACAAPVCAPRCVETAVCDQNTDCAAKICTNHKCAPPACSPTCNDGTACGANSECGSKVCTNAVCAPPACAPRCSQGAACGASGDCGTHVCTGGLCRACSPKCDQGAVCSGNGDCESKVCVGGVCKPPACAPHCNQGTVCGANTDCGSQVCTNGLCAPPACAPHCATGNVCGVNADCLSLVCTGNVCRAPSCSPRCSANSACGVNGDCLSRNCTNGVCRPPACSPTCARGANCDSNTECASHVCTNGLCQ